MCYNLSKVVQSAEFAYIICVHLKKRPISSKHGRTPNKQIEDYHHRHHQYPSVKRIGTSRASMMFFILLQDSFFINYSLLKNFIPAVLPMAATALYLYFIIYERNNQQTKICFLGV